MSGRADVVYGSHRQVACGSRAGSGVGPASTGTSPMNPPAWPRSSALNLGALPTAPGCARAHTMAVLHEWGLSALAETAELLVSELVTNAMRAEPTTSPHGPKRDLAVISLRLLSDGSRVIIEVGDRNPEPPTLTQAELDAESGRGLMLVEALSTRWGWYPATEWYGKVVWVELRAE